MFDSKKENRHYDLIFLFIIFPAPSRAAGEEVVGDNWTDGFLQRRERSLPMPSWSIFLIFCSYFFPKPAVRDKWAVSIISPLSPSAIVVLFIDYQKLSSEQISFRRQAFAALDNRAIYSLLLLPNPSVI